MNSKFLCCRWERARALLSSVSCLLSLLLLLSLGARSAGAADALTETFQRALFEEEANQNPEAAIKAYLEVIGRMDEQRKLAATAVFRLGECYRKLGRTNEAVLQYRRILADFADQTVLGNLSRQNLAGLGAAAAPTLSVAARQEQRRLLEEELKLVEEQLADVKKMAQQGLTSRASVIEKEREVLALKRQLASLGETPASPGPAKTAREAETDVEEKEVQRLQTMIKDSPDLINARDNRGQTPLLKAAMLGQATVVRFLLANRANVLAQADGKAPLHWAAENGHKAVVELLLQNGADVGGLSGSRLTPLHLAAQRGYRAVAEVLIAHKAPLNTTDSYGATPVHVAIQNVFPAMAELLLAKGADVNANKYDAGDSRHNYTGVYGLRSEGAPLHLAAASGHTALVSLLLSNKATVDLRNVSGHTPLHFAIGKGHLSTARLLLEAGADSNAEPSTDPNPGWTPLHLAVQANQKELAVLLLKQGAKPDVKIGTPFEGEGGPGWTPLMIAVWKGYKDLVELLLENKANPNVREQYGRTALWLAVINHNKPLADMLLRSGADPNLRAVEDATCLAKAVELRNLEMAELLLSQHANPNLANNSGWTPLHQIVERSANEGRRLQGSVPPGSPPGFVPPMPGPARISTVPGYPTPATQPGRPPFASLVDLARLLIAHKADVNLRNEQGLTPLNLLGAPPKPTTEIQFALVQLLREHGALEGVPEPAADAAVIRAWRDGLWESRVVFARDTNGFNRFTLMDALRQFYSSYRGSDGTHYRPVFASGNEDKNFDFPDLRRIEIRRLEAGGKYRRITTDLLDATNGVDCAKNLDLEFGDIVVIPEREHLLNEAAFGLPRREAAELANCFTRPVQLIVKGKRHEVPMNYGEYRYLSRWLGRPEAMAVLVSSSDLSRVVVRRRTADKGFKPFPAGWLRLAVVKQDPQSGEQHLEFKADVSAFRRSGLLISEDLLLRGGDEVEVPDRE